MKPKENIKPWIDYSTRRQWSDANEDLSDGICEKTLDKFQIDISDFGR